jgi:hypothetical protein
MVHFSYIHNTEAGIKTIGVDMCKKQAGGMYTLNVYSTYAKIMPGLGDYLHKLDPTREWDEHIEHILVFCEVHLKRNFAKRFPRHTIRHEFFQLLFGANSKVEIDAHMQSICIEYPELKQWILNKKPRWLLAGLTRSESKVPYSSWLRARKHTGVGESSHFQDNNFTGRRTSMLNAVLK